jgi:vibriolysin
VQGYAATSTFTLAIKWSGTGGGSVTPPPTPTPFAHLDVSGSVALGEMKDFTLAVPAGKKVVVRTTAPNDIDLYLQKGAAPTTAAYSQRAWTSGGNETLTFTATEAVTLHIGVHGYVASTFTMKTSDE